MSQDSSSPVAPVPKDPKTERGKRTRRRLLSAAAVEFGERGYTDSAISGITQRAEVGLGTFYVYFNSKEEIFRALVADMGALTRGWIAERIGDVRNRLEAERVGVAAYIDFVRKHKGFHRIIMESQFVAPDAYYDYYRAFADAYRRHLAAAEARGEISAGDGEVRVWALMGASSFLGLRYGVWEPDADIEQVASATADLIANGLAPKPKQTKR